MGAPQGILHGAANSGTVRSSFDGPESDRGNPTLAAALLIASITAAEDSAGIVGRKALSNAREAIAAYVAELRARGEEVPVEVRTETEYLELPELESGT